MLRDIPLHERSMAERYRVASREWAKKRAVFRGYDLRKKITFNLFVLALQTQAREFGKNLTKAQAEFEVTVSEEWQTFINEMLAAEEEMNLAEGEKDSVDMERWERNDESANIREERRSVRMGG